MIESTKLDRLLTQVNCRIARFARLRDAGAIFKRKAEQQLRRAVEFRAGLMRQIDGQNFVLDAWGRTWPNLAGGRAKAFNSTEDAHKKA